MRLSSAALAAAALLTTAIAASAQTCVGFPPFANGPVRASGDLSIANHATTYGASAVFGTTEPGLFGGGSISGTRFDGTNKTGKSLGLSGGFSIPLVSLPGTELCPVADFVHSWGPDIGGFDPSSNTIALGGAIGHAVVASPTVTLVPFADLRWIHASAHLRTGLGTTSASDNFGSLTLGSGIMFTKTVTLRPANVIPISEGGGSSVFLISLAFNLGK
jgi:hypothetical protein